MDEDHRHCQTCFEKLCLGAFGKYCHVVSCLNDCGMLLHACKMADHLTICQRSTRQCINTAYGCPFKLRQEQLAMHLSVCPASTIVCTMEWNRKPLHLNNVIKMEGYNPNRNVYNHLEIALALRDQRVLMESMIPKDIIDKFIICAGGGEKVLENNINCSTVNSEGTDMLENDCENITTVNQLNSLDSKNLETEKIALLKESNVNHKLHDDDVPIRKPLLRTKFHLAAKKVYATVSCDTSDLDIDTTSLEWMNPGIVVSGNEPITCMFEMIGAYEKRETVSYHQHSEGLRCTLSDVRLCSFRHVATQTRPFFKVKKHIGKIGNALQDIFAVNDDHHVLVSHHDEQLYKTLALDRVIDCLPRYERKSRSLYSFMCNNFMRRDQFQAHFQNVHCEIYSNLDGWLEDKCPYTLHGCNYTRLRFSPDSCKNCLTFDNSRSCLTVTSDCGSTTETCNTNGRNDAVYLVDLPWEVLEKVVGYLDSYSIGQIARTCTYLRDVCVSRLKERGIISLNWEKFKRIDGSVSWQVTSQQWLFSNSFSKVNKWVFSDVPSMCEHIRTCPFVAEATMSYTNAKRLVLPRLKSKRDSLPI